MATVELDQMAHERRDSMRLVAEGSTGEAIGGAGAAVLGVLGLAGVLPMLLAAVATVAVGAALVLQGSALSSRYSALMRELSAHTQADMVEIGGGLTTQMMGGIAGIVLGVLAVLNVAPESLVAVAAVGYGVTLLLGSGTTSRLNDLAPGVKSSAAERLAREAVRASAGGEVLIGIGAATLGVLALIGLDALTLSLIAMLAVGASILLTGSALAGRMEGAMG